MTWVIEDFSRYRLPYRFALAVLQPSSSYPARAYRALLYSTLLPVRKIDMYQTGGKFCCQRAERQPRKLPSVSADARRCDRHQILNSLVYPEMSGGTAMPPRLKVPKLLAAGRFGARRAADCCSSAKFCRPFLAAACCPMASGDAA